MHISEMESKIDKKPLFLRQKCLKLLSESLHIATEYLSSGVNVLTNSLKIWNVTKAEIFQLNLSHTRRKIGNSCAVLTSAVFRTR